MRSGPVGWSIQTFDEAGPLTDEAPFNGCTVHVGEDVVVVIKGEVDITTADRMWGLIQRVLHPGQPLVVDMQRVTFFDVNGLRVLLRSRRLCSQLIVRSPSRVVRRVLEVTGNDDVITSHDDRGGQVRQAGGG